jgi:hypothetical protein
MAERICMHEPCGCQPDPGADYCGAHCAGAVGTDDEHDRCGCDHPECRPANARRYDPSDDASPMGAADVSSPPEELERR